MKENRNPNIKKQTLKKESHITISLQILVFLLMIIFGIIYLFIHSVLSYLFLSAILFLLLGAYNSFHYLGKKKMPIFYLFASLLLFLKLMGI